MALDLPDEVVAALPAPPDPWRPVRKESLHVTLAFLGWRDPELVPAIEQAVGGAVEPIAPLRLGEAIVLPPRRPRVMAVRLGDPAQASIRLQASISDALAAAGVYEPERRRWLPHVTIGRARGPVRRDAPLPEVAPLEFVPPSVTLYRSQLARGGAQYEPLARFELG